MGFRANGIRTLPSFTEDSSFVESGQTQPIDDGLCAGWGVKVVAGTCPCQAVIKLDETLVEQVQVRLHRGMFRSLVTTTDHLQWTNFERYFCAAVTFELLRMGGEPSNAGLLGAVRGSGAVFSTEIERRHSAIEQASRKGNQHASIWSICGDVMNALLFEANIQGFECHFSGKIARCFKFSRQHVDWTAFIHDQNCSWQPTRSEESVHRACFLTR